MSANINSYLSSSLSLAQDAITMATVTGSRNGSARVQRVQPDGSLRDEAFVRVDRVVALKSNAWRVIEASDATLVGLVLPQAGLPGRYATHTAPEETA